MFEQTFKNIDDILWKDSGCSTELDYAEQSSWILFLKWLDEFEKYEIRIIDGLDFKAAKYFDIPVNSWKLDKLVPSVLEAHKKCRQINDLDS